MKKNKKQASEKFAVGKNNIDLIGDTFNEKFGSISFAVEKRALYAKTLECPMNDTEILAKLKPTHCTIGDVYSALQGTQVLKNGYSNIFYVEDASHVLWAVFADWDGFGWSVEALSTQVPDRWFVGDRVFSCDPFEPLNSEPL